MPGSTIGNPTIHMVWRVPAEKEGEIDAYWKEHEAWMQKSHSEGADGGDGTDEKAPRLQEFYVAKGKELKNPLDPESGETGNFLYEMSETYFAGAGIAKHMELGGADMKEWFGKL